MADERKPGLLERFPVLRKLENHARRRRKIPEIRQMTISDCGAACLAMVLGYYGRDISLEEMRTEVGVTRDGTSAKAILAAARKMGLRGRGVSLDLNALPYLAPGAILHWRFSHYVVFEKMGRDFVQVVDPAMGRRRVSLEQFSQFFTGVALILEPAEDFRRGSSRRNAYRYFLPILKQSGMLVRILMLSGMVQLFALSVPALMGTVVDKVVPRGDYHLLLVLSAALTTIIVFQLLAELVRGHLLLEVRTRIDSGMTLGFLDHLVNLPYAFFQLRPSGDLLMRLNIQTTIRDILSTGTISSILDGTLVLLYFVVLFATDALMGLVVLVLGLLQVLVFAFLRSMQRTLLSQSLELEARNQSYLISMLMGMQTLKAFGVEERMVQNYSSLYVDVLNLGLARGQLGNWVDSSMRTLRLASPLVLLSLGAYRVLEGNLQLGGMLSMNALATALLVPLSNLLSTGGQFLLMDSYLERLNDVMDADAERPADRRGTKLALKGAITLERVSFRYGEGASLVVQDVSVSIQPGQMVAIVGRSGAGKSTLANLLLGLYLPTSGRVLYDGVDLSELDLRGLRNQIGIVLQDSAFFSNTLRENITLGDPEVEMEQIVAAAKLAHVHEHIMAMPMQYNTPLADRGLSMSGGQRQRLALTRALVRKPAILLLDEATSALDSVTELQVQEALSRLQCTRIVIAHRLSTIRSADLIVVMDEGRILDAGTHEELLARQGAYVQLVSAQLEQQVRAAG